MNAHRGPKIAAVVSILVCLVGLAGVVAMGCGGEWEPSGVGPSTGGGGDAEALLDPVAGALSSSLHGDMVETPNTSGAGDTTTVQGALSSGRASDPKVIYLFYADGNPLPKTDVNACKGTPPKFNCTFAPTVAECQRQIQAYLDRWYADFNVIFTLTRPTSGKFYTEVISSGGGAWCGLESKVAGVSPFLCKDIQGGVAYTFLGGDSAKQTAVIIAQEQAHLVGLEHTKSGRDLMYPTICADCDGFVDEDLGVDGDRCDRKSQNSHEMMKDRLGAWPGGAKPSAFGCMTDENEPTLEILEPADGATVSRNFAVRVEARDDCDLTKVKVEVSPQALKAESKTAPFEWDLTNISGQQVVEVTAYDGAGHKKVARVTVNAPPELASSDESAGTTAGCTVSSGAFSLTGLLPPLTMLLLFPFRRRAPKPKRRRLVTGELEGHGGAASGAGDEARDGRVGGETTGGDSRSHRPAA